jgi:hypothetical protein
VRVTRVAVDATVNFCLHSYCTYATTDTGKIWTK